MIQSTSHFDGYNRADAVANAAAKAASAPKQGSQPRESLSQANSDALRQALSTTPEVRPDVVERGRKLVVDTNYPPRHIIEDLAKLMVESRDVTD
jgi:hypothetical protein